ncbi:MAG TPA: AI-2E family transporter [Caldimonas sp.]|nr:AI-2E family transporter [Caldimonas sp.]
MNPRITPGRVYAVLIVVASLWVVHGFVNSVLAAAVTAIASWPLYERFSARLPARMRGSTAAALFTLLVTVFALAPMFFAVAALVSEVRGALHEIAQADVNGLLPQWIGDVPLLGAWASAHWYGDPGRSADLLSWAPHADTTTYVGWAQWMAQAAARHALIVLFSVLLVFFAYSEGEVLAHDVRRVLRHTVGPRAERYLDVVVHATRASVTSMVVVGLFDGVVVGVGLAIAGAPRAAVWGGIVGAFAAIPFLGYVAIAALALRLSIGGHAGLALVSCVGGCLVLLAGDKILRPMVAREGMRMSFVWVLMGCLGGFEVLGLVGLVVGPVVLALARELWDQRVRTASHLTADHRSGLATESGPKADGSGTTYRARAPIVHGMDSAHTIAANVERPAPSAASTRR